MESKNKIYDEVFRIIFIVLLVCFITLYVSNETGYFDYHNRQNVVLTEQKIKEFEEDIKNGVNMDIENYLENSKINYNNNTSRFGLYLSNKLGEVVKSGIEIVVKSLNGAISD